MIIGDMEIRLRADIARLQRDMDDARRVVGGALDGITRMAGLAKTALAGMAAGFSLAALAHQVIDAQREFDKLNSSLVTATGSTAGAAQAFKALQAFAATTPYSVQEATEAFIKMRSLGLDPSEKALRSYGNTASSMGKGLNQMIEAVADAATGEFERLKEFGIKSQQNGAQVSLTFKGVTTNIGNNAAEIQAYLQKLGETDFAGAMERRAATLDGAISNLGDTWAGVMRDIAQNGVGEAAREGVTQLGGALNDLGAILDSVGGKARSEGKAVSDAGALHTVLTTVFETIAVLGVNVAYVFQQVGKEIGGIAAQATAVLHGDLAQAGAIGEMMTKEAEAARKAVDAKTDAILHASQQAQEARDSEAANLQKNGKDQLAQYQVQLSADEKRKNALNALVDVRKKLLGLDPQDQADMKKIQTALDTGAISQAEYNRLKGQLTKTMQANSLEYKQEQKSLDAQVASIQRATEHLGLLNQRQQEHIQYLKATGQMSEKESINASADAQIKNFNDQIAAQEKLLGIAKKRQDSQKDQDDIIGRMANIRTQIDNAQAKRSEDLALFEQDRETASRELAQAGIVAATAERDSLQQQVLAQFDANQEVGLGAVELAKLRAARLENAAALKEETATGLDAIDGGQALAQLYREQAQQLRDLGEAQVYGAKRQDAFDKNIQDAQALVDIMTALDDAAQSAAQGMAKSFGSVGEAIGGMTTALSGYQRTQAAIAAQLAAATKDAHGDPGKIARANEMAAQASAQAQIKSYGDMGAAAKGFFKENTAGYRAMEGVEKTFRAFEMAMALTNMAQKLGLLGTYTTAVVVGKQTETAAAMASVGPEIAASMAKGQAAAVAGVATQAQGEPYSAWARMAAMAAVMVGLGFAVSGGRSSVSLSQQRQEAQGAGSVLGDSTAKSDSIKQSLDAIEKNTYQGLSIDNSMLASLRSIETNIGSFASQLVRSTNAAGSNQGLGSIAVSDVSMVETGKRVGAVIGAAFGGPLAGALMGAVSGAINSKIPILGKAFTSIFGGKQAVEDSGFGIDRASLASIMSGQAHAFQYADIKTSGGWFSSDKHSEQTNPLADSMNQQFTAIIESLADSVKGAGAMLGLAGDEFTNKLNSFVVDIGHVSLKDLKGDDLQKALEAVFSKLGDDMAQFAVGGMAQFQQVGEGYLETLVRVASEYQTVDVVFDSFGKTLGMVGLESIGARDRLVQLAGGLDKFTSQGEYFLTNFFSDQEQAAALKKRVEPTLAQYGLSTDGPDAMKVFRDFIVALDTTTEAGAKAYTTLMGIAPALKTIADAGVDAAKAAAEAASDAMQAMKDAADSLLGSVDNAFSVLQGVVAREKAVLQTSVDAHSAAVTRLQSLSQALHGAFSGMQSTDQQQMAARAAGQAQISAALASARAGGQLPDADKLKDALSAVQKDASDQFSSYTDYLRDLYKTQSDIGALAGLTDDSLSVEQKALQAAQDQLTALDSVLASAQAQVDELKGQSTTLLSIDQAIAGLGTALLSAGRNPLVSATSAISGAYQQYLGRDPDAGGMDYYQNLVAGGTSIDAIKSGIADSREAQIQALYKSVLGRGADAGGLDYYLGGNGSMSDIAAALKASDEYKTKHSIPGFAGGGDFAGGVRLVGEIGPEVEATGASRIHSTQSLIDAMRNPADNSAVLAAAVTRLTATVEQQQQALDQIQRNTRRQADTIDVVTEGGKAMRTQ